MRVQTQLYIARGAQLAVIAAMLFGWVQSHAAPASGLAVVCEDTSVEGKSLDACPATKGIYKAVAAGDLVRDCGTDAQCWTVGDVWRKYSDLTTGTTYDACTTALESPTRSVPVGATRWEAAGDPCKSWKPVLKAQVANVTGTITVAWDPVLLCIDHDDGDRMKACNDVANPDWAIRGYRVFSGASATALSLLATVSQSTITFTQPGYNDGVYYFAVQAFNADSKTPDGVMSSAISVQVRKPALPTNSASPGVTNVRATVTY